MIFIYHTGYQRKSLSIHGNDKHTLFSILVIVIFRHMDGQSDLGLGNFEVRGHLTLSEQLLLGGNDIRVCWCHGRGGALGLQVCLGGNVNWHLHKCQNPRFPSRIMKVFHINCQWPMKYQKRENYKFCNVTQVFKFTATSWEIRQALRKLEPDGV